MAAKKSIPAEDVLDLDPDMEAINEVSKKFVYVLSEENVDTGMVFDAQTNRPIKVQRYRQYTNLPLRSSIIWDGSDCVYEEVTGEDGKKRRGKLISGRKPGKRQLRYYDGCPSIFVDEQPAEKATIDEFVKNTKKKWFIRGYMDVFGYEDMFKRYMDIASWNENSPYRIRTSPAIYKLYDTEANLQADSEDLDQEEEAAHLAKNATIKHMKIHAKFLEIPELDLVSQNPLSDKAIRTEYRKAAKRNPAHFIETYNDKTILIKYWIEKGLDNGEIATKTIPNKATWGKKGVVICDLSGITSREGILNKLIEHSQLDEGKEFLEMLKAQYD